MPNLTQIPYIVASVEPLVSEFPRTSAQARLRSLLFFGVLCVAAPICRADLLSTQVIGDLHIFEDGPVNLYDPKVSPFVPTSGYQNSPSNQDSALVTISAGPDFGYFDGENLDVTSFDSTGFTFTDTTFYGGSPRYDIKLTGSAFTGFTELSSSFSGTLFWLYDAETQSIIVAIPALSTPCALCGEVRSISFAVLPPPIPESGSLILVLTAVAALGFTYNPRRPAP